MEKSNDEQPPHPAVMHSANVAPGFHPFRHQDDARPEEHRENGHELLVGKHPAHDPDVEVRAFKRTERGGIEISRRGHRKRLDVQHEDA